MERVDMSVNFLSYLEEIAPEGEVILFVRQKPMLPEQFHADGALKCSWPAFLPKKWKPDQAWYCNTGCFIIDRFDEGKPAAKADACEQGRCRSLQINPPTAGRFDAIGKVLNSVF